MPIEEQTEYARRLVSGGHLGGGTGKILGKKSSEENAEMKSARTFAEKLSDEHDLIGLLEKILASTEPPGDLSRVVDWKFLAGESVYADYVRDTLNVTAELVRAFYGEDLDSANYNEGEGEGPVPAAPSTLTKEDLRQLGSLSTALFLANLVVPASRFIALAQTRNMFVESGLSLSAAEGAESETNLQLLHSLGMLITSLRTEKLDVKKDAETKKPEKAGLQNVDGEEAPAPWGNDHPWWVLQLFSMRPRAAALQEKLGNLKQGGGAANATVGVVNATEIPTPTLQSELRQSVEAILTMEFFANALASSDVSAVELGKRLASSRERAAEVAVKEATDLKNSTYYDMPLAPMLLDAEHSKESQKVGPAPNSLYMYEKNKQELLNPGGRFGPGGAEDFQDQDPKKRVARFWKFGGADPSAGALKDRTDDPEQAKSPVEEIARFLPRDRSKDRRLAEKGSGKGQQDHKGIDMEKRLERRARRAPPGKDFLQSRVSFLQKSHLRRRASPAATLDGKSRDAGFSKIKAPRRPTTLLQRGLRREGVTTLAASPLRPKPQHTMLSEDIRPGGGELKTEGRGVGTTGESSACADPSSGIRRSVNNNARGTNSYGSHAGGDSLMDKSSRFLFTAEGDEAGTAAKIHFTSTSFAEAEEEDSQEQDDVVYKNARPLRKEEDTATSTFLATSSSRATKNDPHVDAESQRVQLPDGTVEPGKNEGKSIAPAPTSTLPPEPAAPQPPAPQEALALVSRQTERNLLDSMRAEILSTFDTDGALLNALDAELTDAPSDLDVKTTGGWPDAMGSMRLLLGFILFILEAVVAWFTFLLPLSFLYRLYGLAIFAEKESELMDMQLIYGMRKRTYWVANILFFFVVLGTPFMITHWVNLALVAQIIPLDRLWPSNFLFYVFAPMCPPLAVLLAVSALAMRVRNSEKFESAVTTISSLGNLLVLGVYILWEVLLPTRISFWATAIRGALTTHGLAATEEVPLASMCPDVSAGAWNVVLSTIFGVAVPGYAYMRLNMRGWQMKGVLQLMRHRGSEMGWYSLEPLAPAWNQGLRGHSLYYCARDNFPSPPPDTVRSQPALDLTGLSRLAWSYEDGDKIEQYANQAGAAELSRTLPFADYDLIILLDLLAVFLNVGFWILVVYRIERYQKQATSGDVLTVEETFREAGLATDAPPKVKMVLASSDSSDSDWDSVRAKYRQSVAGPSGADRASARLSLLKRQSLQQRGSKEPAFEPPDRPEEQANLQPAGAKKGKHVAPSVPARGHKVPIVLQVKKVTKTFLQGEKVVNNDVSFEIKRGEIFGLLGHNGAGKTTLLNMISGKVPVTFGKIVIMGRTNSAAEIRKNNLITLCPQGNPLWDNFTVDQHVRFFARLRNVDDVEASVRKYASLLGLSQHFDTHCKYLSGGQKRRLWVLCCLLGSAPVVLMDEPTTGMDPQARRDFWILLKKIVKEEKRSVIFTTHYLEEADLLAERKCILAHGKIRAIGTSQQLKRQLGSGFWIHAMIEKREDANPDLVRNALRSLAPIIERVLYPKGITFSSRPVTSTAARSPPSMGTAALLDRGADSMDTDSERSEKKKRKKNKEPLPLAELDDGSRTMIGKIVTKNPRNSRHFLAFLIPWEKIPQMAAVLEALQKRRGEMLERGWTVIPTSLLSGLHGELADPVRVDFTIAQTTLEEVFHTAGEVADRELYDFAQLAALRSVGARDLALSRAPLRRRQLGFKSQFLAIVEFRLFGSVFNRTTLGHWAVAAFFLAAYFGYCLLMKYQVDSQLAAAENDESTTTSSSAEDQLNLHWAAVLMCLGLASLVMPFAFFLFGGTLVRRDYLLESDCDLQLWRHLSMHGVRRVAYHAGTFASWFIFFATPFWLAFALITLHSMGDVFSCSSAMRGVFVCMQLVFPALNSIICPMFVCGSSFTTRNLWTVFFVCSFAVAFLPMILGKILSTGYYDVEQTAPSCLILEFAMASAGVESVGEILQFGFPNGWMKVWLPIYILFPPIAQAASLQGLYKMWALWKLDVHFVGHINTGALLRSRLVQRTNSGSFNKLAPPSEARRHFDSAVAEENGRTVVKSKYYGANFFLFGHVPEDMPDGDDLQRSLAKLEPNHCQAEYWETVAWYEVLAPLYSFLFYLSVWLLWEGLIQPYLAGRGEVRHESKAKLEGALRDEGAEPALQEHNLPSKPPSLNPMLSRWSQNSTNSAGSQGSLGGVAAGGPGTVNLPSPEAIAAMTVVPPIAADEERDEDIVAEEKRLKNREHEPAVLAIDVWKHFKVLSTAASTQARLVRDGLKKQFSSAEGGGSLAKPATRTPADADAGRHVPPGEIITAEEKGTKNLPPSPSKEDHSAPPPALDISPTQEETTSLRWATRGVTLGVEKTECFALLGPNGAGKTTLFNLLSGYETLDIGEVSLFGKIMSSFGTTDQENARSIMSSPKRSKRRTSYELDMLTTGFQRREDVIGVVPQFDKLWPHLTGRQHVRLYAKCSGTYYPLPPGPGQRLSPDELLGIPRDDGEERVSRFLREVQLSDKDADRAVETYSGGMKRRLSLAVSLVTDPALVFLDEMSAGVDVVAQKALWNKLINRPRGQTVVTTTHSMAEADAVSDRIGILVSGQLKCLGPSYKIKSKYGNGFHLELILNLSKHRLLRMQQELAMEAGGGSRISGIGESVLPAAGNKAQKNSPRSDAVVEVVKSNGVSELSRPAVGGSEERVPASQENATNVAARVVVPEGETDALEPEQGTEQHHNPLGSRDMIEEQALPHAAEEERPPSTTHSVSPVDVPPNGLSGTTSHIAVHANKPGAVGSPGTSTRAGYHHSGSNVTKMSTEMIEQLTSNVEEVETFVIDSLLSWKSRRDGGGEIERGKTVEQTKKQVQHRRSRSTTSSGSSTSQEQTPVSEIGLIREDIQVLEKMLFSHHRVRLILSLNPPRIQKRSLKKQTSKTTSPKNALRVPGNKQAKQGQPVAPSFTLNYKARLKGNQQERVPATAPEGEADPPDAENAVSIDIDGGRDDAEATGDDGTIKDLTAQEFEKYGLAEALLLSEEDNEFKEVTTQVQGARRGSLAAKFMQKDKKRLLRQVNLAGVFRWCAEDPLNIIEDYSFGEPTLEQVFLKFAKQQEKDDASGRRDRAEAKFRGSTDSL
ncbi:unnamed protein product [Amoebophrya sp. A120]|nr:unnamed protein product [Amoebophrya sp. A120]|eukprot:GSA120T00003877001.1